MTFENLTLTLFCMEMLGVGSGYFNVLVVFSVQIWLQSGKNMQEYVNFCHFITIVFQIFPVFSPVRDQLLGRVGQKNIGPGISS